MFFRKTKSSVDCKGLKANTLLFKRRKIKHKCFSKQKIQVHTFIQEHS